MCYDLPFLIYIYIYSEKYYKIKFLKIKLISLTNNMKYKFKNNYMSVLNLSHNHNYSPVLDILVFGSDEVFNMVQYVNLYNAYV